jgi:hypothetical protein
VDTTNTQECNLIFEYNLLIIRRKRSAVLLCSALSTYKSSAAVSVMGAASTELNRFENSLAFHTPFLFTAMVMEREESLPEERK